MKKMIPTLFVTMMLFACSTDESLPNNNDLNGGDTKVEDKESSYQKYSMKDAKKLSFNKEIQLIKITEENSDTVTNRPSFGIAAQDSYITEKRGLHLLYNAELPNKNTEFIVIKEVNDNGYLLDYELHYFDKAGFEIVLDKIDNEVVNNSNRSFMGTKLSFFMDPNKSLHIKKDGVDFLISNGLEEEKNEFLSEDKKGNSKLTVEHYGKINSISDISYDEIKDDDLLLESKRNKPEDNSNEVLVE